MSRLTNEDKADVLKFMRQYEASHSGQTVPTLPVDTQHVLARLALSQESVRSEVLTKEFDTLHRQLTEVRATVDEIESALQSPARVAEGVTVKVDYIVKSLVPKSPAKEQPGEQNAAPQVPASLHPVTDEGLKGHASGPAAAAPDAAAMVKRLREKTRMISRSDPNGCIILTDAEANEAAAMIEKLGQQDTSELMDAVRRYGAVMTNDEIRAQLKPPPPERP